MVRYLEILSTHSYLWTAFYMLCKKAYRLLCNFNLYPRTPTGERLFTCDVCKNSIKQSVTS